LADLIGISPFKASDKATALGPLDGLV
jgi:hypothetical protein